MTPLHYAARKSHFEVFKYTADHSQDRNPADDERITPLHIVAEEGYLEIVKYIAENLENKIPLMTMDIPHNSLQKNLAILKLLNISSPKKDVELLGRIKILKLNQRSKEKFLY